MKRLAERDREFGEASEQERRAPVQLLFGDGLLDAAEGAEQLGESEDVHPVADEIDRGGVPASRL